MKSRPVATLAASALAILALAAAPAWAHHSFAAYDMKQTKAFKGTIKEFRWGAPHSSLVLTSADARGKSVDMSIVTGAPGALARQGFNPRDFHKGDKLEVAVHPNINGSPGGAMSTMKTADGRIYRDGEAQVATPNAQSGQ